jgi:hypothetical protein
MSPFVFLNFEHIGDRIIRDVYVEGGGYDVSLIIVSQKNREREAEPACFVENFAHHRYLLNVG